jgi:ribonuclease P protein component
VVSRRQGSAVRRNRVKRLLREWFRRHLALLPPADIVIVARKGSTELTYEQVRAELTRALLPRGGADQHP